MYFSKFKRSGNEIEDLVNDLSDVQSDIKRNIRDREELKNFPGDGVSVNLKIIFYDMNKNINNIFRAQLSKDIAVTEVKRMLEQDYEYLKEIEAKIKAELKKKL